MATPGIVSLSRQNFVAYFYLLLVVVCEVLGWAWQWDWSSPGKIGERGMPPKGRHQCGEPQPSASHLWALTGPAATLDMRGFEQVSACPSLARPKVEALDRYQRRFEAITTSGQHAMRRQERTGQDRMDPRLYLFLCSLL